MQRVLTAMFIIIGFTVSANAASIDKVKGTQAIVSFDESEGAIKPGDKFFATEDGKKKAILEVVKHKGGRAVVKILKGKAVEGMEVIPGPKGKGGGSSAAAAEPSDEAPADDFPKKKKGYRSAGVATLFKDITYGASFGYGMDSQQVAAAGSTFSMTGSGFGLKGFVDVPLYNGINALFRAGGEQFNVTGSTYKTEIMYGVFDVLLKYAFMESTFSPFVMAGFGIHYPLSKSSSILAVNQISATTVFYGGAGFNYAIGPSTYIHVTGEYGMFPPSNEVTTSFIAGRAGIGVRY